MKPLLLSVAALLIVAFSPFTRAQSCAAESGPPYIAPDVISDPYAAQHLTGYHTFQWRRYRESSLKWDELAAEYLGPSSLCVTS